MLGDSPSNLQRAPVPSGRVPGGHGPRHAKISNDGRFLYVLNELIGSITVFARSITDGALSVLETVSTLPLDHVGFNNSSEIRLSPHGEHFVFAANRGPNSIASFLRDTTTGRLTPLQHISTAGDHPRNFALSPLIRRTDSSRLPPFLPRSPIPAACSSRPPGYIKISDAPTASKGRRFMRSLQTPVHGQPKYPRLAGGNPFHHRRSQIY